MYKRILIGVDDQTSAQTAIRQGVEMARVHHAEIIFLYVLPHDANYTFPIAGIPVVPMLSPEEFKVQARNTASRVLMAASAHAESRGVLSTPSMGSGADAAAYVALAAINRRCGLIVVIKQLLFCKFRFLGSWMLRERA